MVWYVFVIEAIVFAAIFTTVLFAVYHGDRMYSPECIHNYPPDIQEEYFKTHEKVDVSGKSKNVIVAKSCGVLMFTVILTVCAKIAGATTFWHGSGIVRGYYFCLKKGMIIHKLSEMIDLGSVWTYEEIICFVGNNSSTYRNSGGCGGCTCNKEQEELITRRSLYERKGVFRDFTCCRETERYASSLYYIEKKN
ncbi:hypothetical protein [Butyrivibrio sp. ob235]|uniref:hypothetical protein n=1 Tax=Butyrivibrio sp. ob235 TaxID=1761780 RepID=UPI000B32457A|nr:hypothetical protein [Butyrivibrio sp. ob235]